MGAQPHWDKMIRLIEITKENRELQEIFKNGTEAEKLQVLIRHDIDLHDVAMFLDDVRVVMPRISAVAAAWWLW
jgi:hypothetical protein